jgi:diguanylate cyclase (GGDEF)-like protein
MSSTTTAKRVAELTRQIALLQSEIAELGWDTNFGMFTRNALLRHCRSLPGDVRQVAFVDLEAIHSLNLLYGYAEVDARVRATFDTPWRTLHTVARWFSGDEIAVVFDEEASTEQARAQMCELESRAQAQGLGFDWALGRWETGSESVEEAVARLAEEVRCRALEEPCDSGRPVEASVELSGLPRRRGLIERLQRRLARSSEPLTLIHADLDGLRVINAVHGSQSGDQAVLAVLRAIREHAPEALLAREMDSFMVCLSGIALEEAFLVAERIRATVAAMPPLTAGGSPTPVRLSAGVAGMPAHASSARELARHAEEAVFRAKEDGGNCVRLAQPQTMVAKTSHFGPGQLGRLAELAEAQGVSEAELLREALHNLLIEYTRDREAPSA